VAVPVGENQKKSPSGGSKAYYTRGCKSWARREITWTEDMDSGGVKSFRGSGVARGPIHFGAY